MLEFIVLQAGEGIGRQSRARNPKLIYMLKFLLPTIPKGQMESVVHHNPRRKKYKREITSRKSHNVNVRTDLMGMQATVQNGITSLPDGDDHSYFVNALSPAMRELEHIIANVAPTVFPILLMGESGSGKEAVASHIHRLSFRNDKSIRKVLCATLTPESFENLRREAEPINCFGNSSGIGTLLLDEIAEMAPACQTSLLQAIPDGEMNPAAGCLTARIMSTTTRSLEELEEAMDRGSLRRDLFYRLNGVCLRLPPLRERKEDIGGLTELLLRKHASMLGRPQPTISAQTLQIMREYAWPGNIRELENVVKKMVAIGSDSAVSDLGFTVASQRHTNGNVEFLSLKQAARAASRQVEKELILKVLTRTHWNRKRAAQHLQISYKALLYKLRQMGLDDTGSL